MNNLCRLSHVKRDIGGVGALSNTSDTVLGILQAVVNLYVDGELVNDGATTESGSYVAMENTAAPLTVGCSGVTALPVAEFHGRIAMPFVAGKALTAAEVASLYEIYQSLLGV